MKEVRPKVFADSGGTEWRAIDGSLQSRDYPDEKTPLLEEAFGAGALPTVEWIAWLAEKFPESAVVAQHALDHSMTGAEAAQDDALLPEYDDPTHAYGEN